MLLWGIMEHEIYEWRMTCGVLTIPIFDCVVPTDVKWNACAIKAIAPPQKKVAKISKTPLNLKPFWKSYRSTDPLFSKKRLPIHRSNVKKKVTDPPIQKHFSEKWIGGSVKKKTLADKKVDPRKFWNLVSDPGAPDLQRFWGFPLFPGCCWGKC